VDLLTFTASCKTNLQQVEVGLRVVEFGLNYVYTLKDKDVQQLCKMFPALVGEAVKTYEMRLLL